MTSAFSVRAAVLTLLIGQNAGLVLATSYSRTRPVKVMYLGGAIVLLGECVKLVTSFTFAALEAGSAAAVLRQLFADRGIAWKFAVPALLYTLQNNLAFVALSNLSAATYQLTAQLKIPMTATMAWLLLGKRISSVQWLAVLLLCAGVVLVQTQPDTPPATDAPRRSLVGLCAVLTQGCASAFAGVWFEKVLKTPQTDDGRLPSLWTSSLLLSAFSLPLALAALVTHDGRALRRRGLLQGFDLVTWLVLVLHVMGGVLVALTLKHADNGACATRPPSYGHASYGRATQPLAALARAMRGGGERRTPSVDAPRIVRQRGARSLVHVRAVVKTFAVSVSIALSCGGSYLLFETTLSPMFFAGALTVLAATLLYSLPDALAHRLLPVVGDPPKEHVSPPSKRGGGRGWDRTERQPLCELGAEHESPMSPLVHTADSPLAR